MSHPHPNAKGPFTIHVIPTGISVILDANGINWGHGICFSPVDAYRRCVTWDLDFQLEDNYQSYLDSIEPDKAYAIQREIDQINKDTKPVVEQYSIQERMSHTITALDKRRSWSDREPAIKLLKRALSGDVHAMFKCLHELTKDNPELQKDVQRFSHASRNAVGESFLDCFSDSQHLSKEWLINSLIEHSSFVFDQVLICAGWYGNLAQVMFESETLLVEHITSVDIDPDCKSIAECLNANRNFTAKTGDVYDLLPDYYNQYDLVVNTSCEHMDRFSTWFENIPSGITIALQSNNYAELDEHVNCVNNLEEFKKMAPMEYDFEGELVLPKYTRYMLIGHKQ